MNVKTTSKISEHNSSISTPRGVGFLKRMNAIGNKKGKNKGCKLKKRGHIEEEPEIFDFGQNIFQCSNEKNKQVDWK